MNNDFEVLERFYKNCLEFWEREGVDNAKEMAIKDVERITTNPFIPKNAPNIDEIEKQEFIKSIM